eukprot:5791984-Pleurochrysis_carterae.AAC.1
MAWPAGAAASGCFEPTHHPRSTAKFVGESDGTVGSGGTAKSGAPHAEVRGAASGPPTRPDWGAHSTAATSGNVRGQGPREGQGGRSPRALRPRRLQSNLERGGCASAHAGVARTPSGGKGADHT